ncbi:hypothetical protein Tco_0859143 [Tanacetum coccineum]|uniref:Uncharacterized protein n=1 Tax=Tanacetum coccineum TaxID=301880 RepID=A0ABQ5BBY0_9ASTR
MVVQNKSELGEGSTNPTDPITHSPLFNHQLNLKRHKNLGSQKERILRFATTAIRLEAEVRQWFESVSKHSNDLLLARGNTLRSDEDRLKLNELMALCTTLQNRVLDLEKTKTTQQNKIASLKRRVKKLEKKIDVAQVITAATTVTITTEKITLAQALEALKTSKPKVKGIVFQEPDEEEVAIDVIPLVVKSPSIVDWKIHKEGKKSYYQIIELMESLNLVKAKFESTKQASEASDSVVIGCFENNVLTPIIQKLRGNSRDRLDSYSFGNFAKIAAVTA